jgi:hypothetical protein
MATVDQSIGAHAYRRDGRHAIVNQDPRQTGASMQNIGGGAKQGTATSERQPNLAKSHKTGISTPFIT